jgi:dolichol kinase
MKGQIPARPAKNVAALNHLNAGIFYLSRSQRQRQVILLGIVLMMINYKISRSFNYFREILPLTDPSFSVLSERKKKS